MAASFPFTIGVGVFIRNGNTLLVGKRGSTCKRGAGCIALPGGHVEPGETIVQAVLREVQEETGLAVQISGKYPIPPGKDPALYNSLPFAVPGMLAVTDHSDIHQQMDGRLVEHLSLWMMTVYAGGVPETKEPDKCTGWWWARPQEIAKLEGVENPTHPQYYWTPIPLWRKILRPYFGEF